MTAIADKLQKTLDKAVDGRKVFGTTFRLKYKDFEWSGASGNLAVDSPYFTASTTKLFTTALIMRLRQQKKLELDDKLTRYFSPAILNGLHVYKGRDYSGEISIRNLLAHTSGIPDYFQGRNDKGDSLEKELLRDDRLREKWEGTRQSVIEELKQQGGATRPEMRMSNSETKGSVEANDRPETRAPEPAIPGAWFTGGPGVLHAVQPDGAFWQVDIRSGAATKVGQLSIPAGPLTYEHASKSLVMVSGAGLAWLEPASGAVLAVAAETVPEYRTLMPTFAPRLIPETTRSTGSRTSSRMPSFTQSAGVPSTA